MLELTSDIYGQIRIEKLQHMISIFTTFDSYQLRWLGEWKIKYISHGGVSISMKEGKRKKKTEQEEWHVVSGCNFHKTQTEPSQIFTVPELLKI